MAVPKKKISYSRTRKRFLSKRKDLNLYVQCDSCPNFIKLHRACLHCLKNPTFVQLDDHKLETNINYLIYNMSSLERIFSRKD
jgi:ribosomal protein L32